MEIDLKSVLREGQKYRIVGVHDIWAEPVAQGTYDGKVISLKMTGPYAPEFACYVLFRRGE